MARLSGDDVLKGLRAAIALRHGAIPTETELAEAPVLTAWALVEAGAGLHRLVGSVRGHPILGTGWCTTSVVLALDPGRAWARTVSRMYRLADPLLPPNQ